MKRTKIVLTVVIIMICFCCDSLLIVHYNYKREKLYSMETPMNIANEYMQPQYREYWYMLDDVFSARKDSRTGRYIVARGMENVGASYFSKNTKESEAILCETNIEIDHGGVLQISTIYNNPMNDIWVVMDVYDKEKGYWEKQWFTLKYGAGEYISNNTDLEKMTGMTIEEIVEVAEKQQEACEDMLHEMKAAEVKRNKVVLFLGLVLINGTGVCLVIWKGFKRKGR